MQRSEQIDADLGEVEAQLADLQERRVAAEARFEELDMQLADSQEREAQLGDRVIETERKLNACREQQRMLERQVQEATFSQRQPDARRAELNRSIETATQQATAPLTSSSAPRRAGRLSDAAAQGGLQQALDLKMDRKGPGRPAQRIRRPDSQTARQRRAPHAARTRWTRCASASPNSSSGTGARLGLEQYTTLLTDAQADLRPSKNPLPTATCACRACRAKLTAAPRNCRAGRRQPGRAG